MSRFLLVFTGGGMPETPEEQEAVMAAWGRWYQDLGQAVTDPGNPLGTAKNIAGGAVTDGAVSSPPASGFTILNADSMDAAVEMARGCPILEGNNGQVTVYEAMAM